MRQIWSGGISFGLIYIPVKLYSGTTQQKLDFDYLEKKTHCPVKYRRVCERTGEEVKWKDIVRGYEIEKDAYVVLDDQDFEKASPRKTNSIEVKDFIEKTEIDCRYFKKPYFLEPQEKAEKTYALFREALERTNKVAVAKFVLRTREKLGIVYPLGSRLILNTLRFDNEIRKGEDLNVPVNVELNEEELKTAMEFINKLSKHFKPEKYTDTYREELLELIEAKSEGKTVKKEEEKPEATDSSEVLDQLRKSLQMTEQLS